MKRLCTRLSKLSLIVMALALAGLLLGFPAKWIGIVAFVVIDFAGIAWAGQDSPPADKLPGALWRLCQFSCGQHQQVMACASTQDEQVPKFVRPKLSRPQFGTSCGINYSPAREC